MFHILVNAVPSHQDLATSHSPMSTDYSHMKHYSKNFNMPAVGMCCTVAVVMPVACQCDLLKSNLRSGSELGV